MPRAVMHLELPGVHAAAAVELGHVRGGAPIVVHRRERILDLWGLPVLSRGQPVRLARKLAPQAEFVPVGALAGAETYRAAWDILQEVGPELEPTAWHAGYVNVSGCLPRHGAKVYLAQIARRLEAVTGLPPARGIGESKLIARHASPQGEIIAPGETLRFLHAQPLRSGQGLSRPMVEQLGELGCHTWREVSEVPEPRLRALFGIRGTILHRWSQGIDPRPVQNRYPPPTESVSAEVEGDEHGLWLGMFESLTQRLAGRLERRGELATEVILALGGADGWRSFKRRLARGTADAARLEGIVFGLLPADLDPWSIDEVRLTLRGLRPRGTVQGVLFLDAAEERRHLLDAAMLKVRARYGLTGLGYGPELLAGRERLAEAVWKLDGVMS